MPKQKRYGMILMQGMNEEDKQREVLDRLRQERLISAYLSQLLTRDAYERMSTVKFVKRELYIKVAGYLLQLKSQGKINEPINDKVLKQILFRFGNSSKGITIRRK